MDSMMKLGLMITAVDTASAVFGRLEGNVSRSAKNIKSKFESIQATFGDFKTAALTSGAAWAGFVAPGMAAAANLEEAMLRVKMNVSGGATSVEDLNKQLGAVKKSAVGISQNAPFSAEDLVNIENALLKAGVDLSTVTSKSGAAFAASALASVSGEAPEVIGDALARIGTQFGLKGDQYGAFADWLARIDDVSASSIPEIIQGLRMAGSQAAAMGVNINDAVTVMGALAPLGERAGSSFSNLLIGMTKSKDFYKGGSFVGMEAALDILKKKTASMKTDQERITYLNKAFGEEGSRAANELLKADKAFKGIEASAEKSISLTQKMDIWGEGFNAKMKKLGGTVKSTLASTFQPLLGIFGAATDAANNIAGNLGNVAEENKTGAAIFAGSTIAASLLPLMLFARRFMPKTAGTAAGVAEGKALQAATGVTPVFVTNFSEMPGGGGSAIPGMAGGAAAGSGTAIAAAVAPYALAAAGTVAAEYAASKATQMLSEGRYQNIEEAIYDNTFGGGRIGRNFVEANQKSYENFNIPSLNDQVVVNATFVADMDRVPVKLRSQEIARRKAQAGIHRYHGGDGGYGGGGY